MECFGNVLGVDHWFPLATGVLGLNGFGLAVAAIRSRVVGLKAYFVTKVGVDSPGLRFNAWASLMIHLLSNRASVVVEPFVYLLGGLIVVIVGHSVV